MSMTTRVTESSTVVGMIAANAGTPGTFLSEAISLTAINGRRLVAYVSVGTIGASGTVDVEFEWAATSGGSYTAIASTAITQDTAGSKVHQIEVLTEYLMAENATAKFVKLKVVTGTAATPFAAVIVGHDGSDLPHAAGTDVGQTITYP